MRKAASPRTREEAFVLAVHAHGKGATAMIGAGIPKAQLMDSDTMSRVLTRMAHEIMERADDLQDLILVGDRKSVV